jgi:antitoxin ParD1/3/4
MANDVSLPPDVLTLIDEKVANGQYSSREAVISDALLLLREYDQLAASRLKMLQADIMAGQNSGPGIPAAEVFAALEKRFS